MNRLSVPVLELAVTIAFAVAAIAILYGLPHTIAFDQVFIQYRFDNPVYPRFNMGITTSILAGLFNRLAHPGADWLDFEFRALSLLLLAGSAFALARAVLSSTISRVLFAAFLFFSRYYFLWLSSEVIVAALICLSVRFCLLARRSPDSGARPIAVTCLAALAFTKPDLLLVAVALLAVLILWTPGSSRRLSTAGLFVALAAVLVVPGLVVSGSEFFSSRAFSAFGQHYSDLVYPHQLGANPADPWSGWRQYHDRLFPGTESLLEVIWRFPTLYCDFLFLSASESFRNSLWVFGPLLACFPLAVPVWRGERKGGTLRSFLTLFAVSLIGLVPIATTAYLHVRYLTRFYPLAVLAALGIAESPALKSRRQKNLARALVVAGLAWAVYGFATDAWGGFAGQLYWFPD